MSPPGSRRRGESDGSSPRHSIRVVAVLPPAFYSLDWVIIMRIVTGWFALCVVVSAVLVGGVSIFADQNPAAAAADADGLTAEDKAAQTTFENVCSTCHDTAVATTTLRTPQEWNEILELMTSFGASASDVEFTQVQRYLNRRYGRINLNRATAEDLQLVLNVSEALARAIVEYRMTARFTTADDLKNVSGFPAARIEALKPHLQV